MNITSTISLVFIVGVGLAIDAPIQAELRQHLPQRLGVSSESAVGRGAYKQALSGGRACYSIVGFCVYSRSLRLSPG